MLYSLAEILSSILRFFSRKRDKTFVKKSPSDSSQPQGIFYITIRILLSMFNAFFICLKVFFNLVIGKIVILDRCFIDELVQLRYKGLNKRIFIFFIKITPIFKNIFYLEINSDIALQREGGHNFDYFQRKANFYKETVEMRGIKKIQVITQEETFQQILENFI